MIAYAQEDHAHPCRAGRRRLGQPPLLFTQQQTEVLKVKSLRLQLSLSVIFQRPRTGVCQHVRDLHKHVARNRRCEGSQVQKDDCHVTRHVSRIFFSPNPDVWDEVFTGHSARCQNPQHEPMTCQ